MNRSKTHRFKRRGRVLADVFVAVGCLLCFLVILWRSNSSSLPALSFPQIALLIACLQLIVAAVVFLVIDWSREVTSDRRSATSARRPLSDGDYLKEQPPANMRLGKKRRGAAALEFAIVIIMLLVAILSMVELSRAMMVHQVLVNASREAARRAIVPGATDAELTGIITNYLTASHIPLTHTTSIYVEGSVASLSTAKTHDTIAVRVSIPVGDVAWGTLGLLSVPLASEVTMRKE